MTVSQRRGTDKWNFSLILTAAQRTAGIKTTEQASQGENTRQAKHSHLCALRYSLGVGLALGVALALGGFEGLGRRHTGLLQAMDGTALLHGDELAHFFIRIELLHPPIQELEITR